MKYLLCLFSCFLYVLAPAQNMDKNSKSDSVKQAAGKWTKNDRYINITSYDFFRKGMSDDEMAGILMKRGNITLKIAGAFLGISAVGIGSCALLLNGQNKDLYVEAYVIGAISVGLALAVIPVTIGGINRISEAGIVKQHKKYILKLSATGVSLNF